MTSSLKHIVDELATKNSKVEGSLKSSEEHEQLLKEKVSNQSSYLLAKDAELKGHQEQVTDLEKEVKNLSADVKHYRTQKAMKNHLHEGVCTVLFIEKMASQQCSLGH